MVAECPALIRALALTTSDLQQVIRGANCMFCEVLGNGRFVSILANTVPMGVVADLPVVASKPFQFAEGDLFILITDGFYEWRRPGGEQFGVDRLLEVIRRHRDKSCDEIIRCLQEAVLDFSEGSEQLDDLTVIVLKRDASVPAISSNRHQ